MSVNIDDYQTEINALNKKIEKRQEKKKKINEEIKDLRNTKTQIIVHIDLEKAKQKVRDIENSIETGVTKRRKRRKKKKRGVEEKVVLKEQSNAGKRKRKKETVKVPRKKKKRKVDYIPNIPEDTHVVMM